MRIVRAEPVEGVRNRDGVRTKGRGVPPLHVEGHLLTRCAVVVVLVEIARVWDGGPMREVPVHSCDAIDLEAHTIPGSGTAVCVLFETRADVAVRCQCTDETIDVEVPLEDLVEARMVPVVVRESATVAEKLLEPRLRPEVALVEVEAVDERGRGTGGDADGVGPEAAGAVRLYATYAGELDRAEVLQGEERLEDGEGLGIREDIVVGDLRLVHGDTGIVQPLPLEKPTQEVALPRESDLADETADAAAPLTLGYRAAMKD